MPPALPTADSIEEHLQHVEQTLLAALSSAAPSVHHIVDRLQADLARFWPQSFPPLPPLPDMIMDRMPSLGAFEVPPPPPPLPVAPKSTMLGWVGTHPWKAVGLGVGVVGVGLAVGYGFGFGHGGGRWTRGAHGRGRRTYAVGGGAVEGERRQVVVVLGGDEPLAYPLIVSLQQCGYIVIASVRTHKAAEDLEQSSEGYLRAIVLDPSDPSTVPLFLRSLLATMSRRFPTTSSGDPHSSPNTQLYIHSVVSMLTMPSPHFVPPTGPLENLGMQDSYPAYLQASHLAPLQILQSLLPLMRNSPRHARKSIVVCVPAIDGRVGLPFAGAQAMSAAATLRGVEVLRREIRVAAATEDTADAHATARSMKHVRVVVVDVGHCGQALHYYDEDVERATMDWSASEKATYGVAFGNALVGSARRDVGGKARAQEGQFVRTLVDVISGGTKDARVGGNIPPGWRLTVARMRQWLRGDRIGVGAGVWTYSIASRLPTTLLDGLLTLPHILLTIRNTLLARRHIGHHPPTPLPPPAAIPATAQAKPAAPAPSAAAAAAAESDAEHEMSSENGSDADVESSSGYTSGVGESWISLHRDLTEQPWR